MSDSIVKILPYSVNLDETIGKTPLPTLFATEDKEAHRIELTLNKGGRSLNISGAGVTGYFIRHTDRATVPITGSVEGGKAVVVLSEACYALPGKFTLTIKISSGSVNAAVFHGEGGVTRSRTDSMVDPEGVIPSIDELLAHIAEMEAATAAANTAASGANTAASGANKAANRANSAASAAQTAADAANEAANGYISLKAYDSSNLGGKPPAYYIQHRNLLDNSDFTDPINQRSLSSVTGHGYIIDRWRSHFSANVLELTADGIKVTTTSTAAGWHWRTVVPGAKHIGKTITAYAEIAEVNDMLSASFYISCRDSGDNQISYATCALAAGVLICSINVPANTVYIRVGVYNSAISEAKTRSFTVTRMALYEGAYADNNVPPYSAKERAAELLACQQYLMVYPSAGDYIVPFASGYAHSATSARFEIDLPIQMMLDQPTLTLDKVTATVRAAGETITPTEISVIRCRGNKLYIQATVSGMTAGTPCSMSITGIGGKIVISAED